MNDQKREFSFFSYGKEDSIGRRNNSSPKINLNQAKNLNTSMENHNNQMNTFQSNPSFGLVNSTSLPPRDSLPALTYPPLPTTNPASTSSSFPLSSAFPIHSSSIEGIASMKLVASAEKQQSSDSSRSSSQNTINSFAQASNNSNSNGNSNYNNNTYHQNQQNPNSSSNLSFSQQTTTNRNSTTSASSSSVNRKRGRFDVGDPDLILDDYSKSKKIVHEGFRALKLSDQLNYHSQQQNGNSSSNSSLPSLLDSLFEISNPANQPSRQSSPENTNKSSSMIHQRPPTLSAPVKNRDNNRHFSPQSNHYQGANLRKISSMESDYSVQSDSNFSQNTAMTGNQSQYDSDDSTTVASGRSGENLNARSRKRSNNYRHRKVHFVKRNKHNTTPTNIKGHQQEVSLLADNPIDLEGELYEVLKNGKRRQYSNPVDYYVDELIRKSRRTEMNQYLEQKFQQHSSSSQLDNYVDEGFANAVIGPQPRTDHAISLILPPKQYLLQMDSSARPLCENKNPFQVSNSRNSSSAMICDNEDDENDPHHERKPILRKGDVTHSDWEIEEISSPAVDPSESSNQTASDIIILGADDLTDNNTVVSITSDSHQQHQDYLKSLSSVLQRRLMVDRQDTSDSINSNSRDYGGSLGDMSDGNDSDMACCDDWSNYLSSPNNSGDEEEEGYVENGGNGAPSNKNASNSPSMKSGTKRKTHQNSLSRGFFSSNDLNKIREQQRLRPNNPLAHRSNLQTPSFQSTLFHHLPLPSTSATHTHYHSDNTFNSLTMDSDEGEPSNHHLENDSFPTQQNHMQFFEDSQQRKELPILPERKETIIDGTPLFHSVSDDETEDVINVGVF